MGSPIAPLLADVFMNHVLDKALASSLEHDKPTKLFRYVDDLFLTFSNDCAVQRFLDTLNSIHSSIKFTQERESNSGLTFLDVLITIDSNKLAQTSVFRKATHTGVYLKFNSLVPNRYKRNLVNCLLLRAYKISSSYQIIHNEFQIIKSMLMNNGYPVQFVDSCIKDFLNKCYNRSTLPKDNLEKTEKAKYLVFRILFSWRHFHANSKRTSTIFQTAH